MGYTNYYDKSKHFDSFPEQFVKECEQVVGKSGVEICDWRGDEGTQATITDQQIALNGAGENSHESFVITAAYSPDENRNSPEFNFCKTARKPYDIVVKGILMLAMKHGIIDNWSFDGSDDEQEYQNACNLLTNLKLI